MKRSSDKFELTIDFAVGSRVEKDLLKEDLRYIKEKVQTYRAIHTEDIDEVIGKYFESVVTMVTALEYIIYGAEKFTPIRCTVLIIDHDRATVDMQGWVHQDKMCTMTDGFPLDFTASYIVNISLMYTMKETFGNPAGIFTADMSIDDPGIEDTEGNNIIAGWYASIGNSSYDDIYSADGNAWDRQQNFHYNVEYLDLNNMDGMLCILANPDNALRYCENFPAPSLMTYMASQIFNDFYTRRMTRDGYYNNQKGDMPNADVLSGCEERADTERDCSSGEEVPEEGSGREADRDAGGYVPPSGESCSQR